MIKEISSENLLKYSESLTTDSVKPIASAMGSFSEKSISQSDYSNTKLLKK